jgi:hypothetical protein
VTPRPGLAPIALAFGLAACGRGGSAPDVVWVGEAGAARVLAVTPRGLSVAAESPALDTPVRALLPLASGVILALQEVDGGAAPGALLSSRGARLGSLAAHDQDGTILFDAAARPWAAAQAPDGRIWVTGRRAPVLYGPEGTFLGTAAELPQQTRGIAALPDGRVVVTLGAHEAALYAADGASFELLAVDLAAGFVSPDPFFGLDALAVRPDGSLLVAALRWGVSTNGVLVHARLETGRIVAVDDPERSVRLPTLPSAVALSADAVLAGPSIARTASPACAERLGPDLTSSGGCVAPGFQRGVARVR